MSDQMKKLLELKKKMEEIQQRLDAITVEGSAGDGAVTVTLSGNRQLRGIAIADGLCSPGRKQEMIDYLEIAWGDALEKSENVSRSEMMAAGPGILPGFGP